MSNQFDEDEVKSYIDAIEEQESFIESKKGEYMNYARQRRDEIKKIFDDAKENGIPKEVLKGLLADRAEDVQRKRRHDAISDDYKPLYKDLRVIFAGYKEPVQQEMFGDDGAAEEASTFDPDFADPAAANEAAEQEEGAEILESAIH